MAKKKSGLIFSVIGLAFFELLFYVWATFPKSLFGTFFYSYKSGKAMLSELITRGLFFVLFYCAWSQICPILSHKEDIAKKEKGRYLFFLVLSQALIDGLMLFVEYKLPRYDMIVCDFFTVSRWMIIAIITKKCLLHFFGNTTVFERLCLLVAALLLVFIAFDLKEMETGRLLAQKYQESSTYLKINQINVEYEHALRNMLLDYMCGAAVLLSIYNGSPKGEDIIQPRRRQRNLLVLRTGLLLMALFFVAIVKAAVLPISSIGFERSGVSHSHSERDCQVSIDSKVLNVYRIGEDGLPHTVYINTLCEVWYGNKKLVSFKTPGENGGYSSSISDGTIRIQKNWIEREKGDTVFSLINDKYFVWQDGEDVRTITLGGWKSKQVNPRITVFLEALLEDGVWACPEYSFHYLAEKDYAFVRPYLERYAREDFTQMEIQNNSDIRVQYIVRLAQSELHEHMNTGAGSLCSDKIPK